MQHDEISINIPKEHMAEVMAEIKQIKGAGQCPQLP